MLLSDYQFYLPEMMMYKVDRTSMANSVETRSPFVDHELIEYVLSHTTEYTEGQAQKQVLKDYLVGDFGKEFVNRKKQGFVFDIESWIFNNVNYFYENIRNSHLSNYIDLTSLNLLKLNKSRINSHRIWKLYVLGKFIN
jgi:asparagine synthase (glutamine-hydrolysing)